MTNDPRTELVRELRRLNALEVEAGLKAARELRRLEQVATAREQAAAEARSSVSVFRVGETARAAASRREIERVEHALVSVQPPEILRGLERFRREREQLLQNGPAIRPIAIGLRASMQSNTRSISERARAIREAEAEIEQMTFDLGDTAAIAARIEKLWAELPSVHMEELVGGLQHDGSRHEFWIVYGDVALARHELDGAIAHSKGFEERHEALAWCTTRLEELRAQARQQHDAEKDSERRGRSRGMPLHIGGAMRA